MVCFKLIKWHLNNSIARHESYDEKKLPSVLLKYVEKKTLTIIYLKQMISFF